MAKREKHKCKVFYNKGTKEVPAWIKLCSVTAFSIVANPETETVNFLCSEFPEDVVKSYKPTIEQTLYCYKEDEVYKYIEEPARKLDIDFKSQLLVVYDHENTEGKNVAALYDATFIWGENNIFDGTITYNLTLNNAIHGTADVVDNAPTFTPEVAV